MWWQRMQRPRIDRSIHAQLDRLMSLLRDIERSGGKDRWSHLSSHGHKYPTINSAMRQGYVRQPQPYHYELTDAGRSYLRDTEEAALRS